MLKFVLLFGLLGCATSSPLWLGTQFHDQDGAGSYRYGYQGPHHAKMETRSNGITQGGYSYIDANGILQSVAYTADALNGFRVRASNLPQAPENPSTLTSEGIVAARRKPYVDYEKNDNTLDDGKLSNNQLSSSAVRINPFLLSSSEAAQIHVPKPNLSPSFQYNSPNVRYDNTGIMVRSIGPMIVPVPYRMPHSSLRHTQDSLGQYDYSYAGDTSAKSESRSLDGTTRGAYSYIDANGLLQQVHYIADHNGFRVLATNLPEAR